MKSRIACAAAAAIALMAAPAAQAYDETPMRLPTLDRGAAAASAEPATWLIAATRGATSATLARRHGAKLLQAGYIYRLPAARARAFAGDLRRAGALVFAEPDVRMRRASAFDALPDQWARLAVVDAGLAPPPPGAASLAIIDDLVDTSLPDLAHVRQANPGPILGPHGTMVASAAAAAFNGSGVFGIFPGAPVLSIGLPVDISCSDAANGILAAARAGVRVINLSFGSPGDCATLFVAVQVAYASGALVVASSGNEFASGNPVIYPAAYPHVLSVGALDTALQPSGFSSENTAVDVAAPGVAVPLAIPLAFDTDGTVDGVTLADGTSFSSPIVAGAATWLATARPNLSNGQIADVLRRSARDVGPAGYDAGAGFGLVRMSGALTYPTPTPDILEPNDGILFVNGTVFGKPDPYIWKGTGRRTLSGQVDQVEDPIDVYRVRIPKRARFQLRLKPNFGDPDLTLFRSNARGVDDTSAIIARSRKGPRKTEILNVVNNSPNARTGYVMIDVSRDEQGTLNSTYKLTLQRLKRR